MATRSQLIKNVKSRISYYGKQGYVFADFRPEELSTQKLVAIQKLNRTRFLTELSPEVVIQKSDTEPAVTVTLKEFREIKFEESKQERLIKAIRKRVKGYTAAGFGFQDLDYSDLVKKDLKELSRIANVSRETFIKEYGTYYSYEAFAPGAKSPKYFTITAEQQLEVEKAEKAARLARVRAGQPVLKGKRFFYPEGRARYVAGLKEQAKPGYFEKKLDTYYKTYMRELQEASKYNEYAKYVEDELKKKDANFIKKKIDEGIKNGISFNLLEVYDSNSSNLSVMLSRSIELFELEEYNESGENF